jgi:hypothetical protein
VMTYTTGCIWFFLSNNINTDEDVSNKNTFITFYGLD